MNKATYLLIILLLAGCSVSYHNKSQNYVFKSVNGNPNYADLDYWAAHPWKSDPSDSVPKPLKSAYHPDSAVDIFFIYPTSYTDTNKIYGWNAPIDNAQLNAKTDYTSMLNQASVFNEAGRVFSPRYRQSNLSAYYPVTREDTVHAIAAFELAYSDIKAAFEYYLLHYNNGRPIIIASHSQGTTHAQRLLKEYFDQKPLKQKLIAAYIVGIYTSPQLCQNIPACEKPDQTGCICSWRTFKKGYTEEFVKKEKQTAIVTNPLTWDSSKPIAYRNENPGSILFKFNKIKRHVADAINHGGVLWTRKPVFFGNFLFNYKNYHIADYNLYYISIRKNAALRVETYLKNQQVKIKEQAKSSIN